MAHRKLLAALGLRSYLPSSELLKSATNPNPNPNPLPVTRYPHTPPPTLYPVTLLLAPNPYL